MWLGLRSTWLYQAWCGFPHYWPFVRGINRSLLVCPDKGPAMWSFDVFYVVCLNKLLNRPPSCLWFQTRCRSHDATGNFQIRTNVSRTTRAVAARSVSTLSAPTNACVGRATNSTWTASFVMVSCHGYLLSNYCQISRDLDSHFVWRHPLEKVIWDHRYFKIFRRKQVWLSSQHCCC